jgi:hypothetical protein
MTVSLSPIRPATKNVIVELVLLGLARSRLKDTGLDALRGVLLSDARLAVLDGEVDLQPVWDVLEGQPGWDAAAARGPFCFVKSLEPRLQVTVNLPGAMATLTAAEIAGHAAGCRPKRDDIERAIADEPPRRRRWSREVKAVAAPRAEPAAATPRWKKALGIGAAAVTCVSLVYLAHLLVDELGGPTKPTRMEPAEVSSSIPLRSVEQWGNEVHAVLADPSWLAEPEPARRKQLEGALGRLAARKLGVLVITDEANRTRATAQSFGRPPQTFVRFY